MPEPENLVTQVVTPARTEAEAALVSQYELEDSHFDPELDAIPTKKEAPAPAVEAPAERDAAGRFLPKAKKHEHSPRLVRMATDFGIPEAEIAETAPDALEAVVHNLQRRLQAERQTNVHREVTDTTPAATVEPATPTEPEIDWGQAEDGTPYTEKDYAPMLAKAVKQAAKIDQLEKRLAAVEGVQRSSQQNRMMSRFDKLFSEQEKIFGQGPTQALDPTSAEAARRAAVLAHLSTLVKSKKHSTPEADFAQAAKLLFGAAPVVDEAPGKNGHSRITPEEWEEAGLARPTHRETAKEPKGTKRAVKAVAEKMKERGITEDDFDSFEEAGLPD